MFSTHVRDRASAYIHGEVDEATAREIGAHLKTCRPCRTELESIRRGVELARFLRPVEAPPELWAGIQEKLRSPAQEPEGPRESRKPASRLIPGLLLGAAAVLAILVPFWVLRVRGVLSPSRVDLAEYLTAIERLDARAASTAIASRPAGFQAAEKESALRAANVDRVAGVAPVPGYSLMASRAHRVDGREAVQLVYGNGRESFAVFVAPASLPFQLGGRRLSEIRFGDIACRKVADTNTSMFLFGAGRFHCLLVSPSTDADKAAAIISYFVTAHRGHG